MKGIVLAAGRATRLYPATRVINKPLMPIYDKPMVYYSLSILIQAGIRDILIITTQRDLIRFKDLLGDGSAVGCNFSYKIVEGSPGLAISFIVGKEFIGTEKVALILGDNLFYGAQLEEQLEKFTNVEGAVGFAAHVSDPERYGVYEFDDKMNVISIEEKPNYPKSKYAVSGLFFCDNEVVKIANEVKPSVRGELEITSVLEAYLKMRKLKVQLMKKGTWFDMGTFDSMLKASQFVQKVEKKRGIKIGCIEEVAYRKGYIDIRQLHKLAEQSSKSGYGDYLMRIK